MSNKYSDKIAAINHCFSFFSVFFRFSLSCCRGIAVQTRKTQAFIEKKKSKLAAEIAVLQTKLYSELKFY